MAENSKIIERKALILSAAGALTMAFLGFGFAVLTHSEAIMLDGLFSLLGFVMALAAIRISSLVYEPGSSRFQFGYAGFEPLFNVVKGLVIVFISLLAFYSSVIAMRSGGREIDVGWALVYAVIVASSCFLVFAVLTRVAHKTGSSLVAVDAKNWLLDGLITLAVLLGLLLAYLVEGTDWDWVIPYADPVIVLVLVILAMPIPYLIIRDGVRELLLAAPDSKFQQQLNQVLAPELQANDFQKYGMRVTKTGRMLYIYIFVLLQKGQIDPSVLEQDALRNTLTDRVSSVQVDVEVDLFFTREAQRLET